MTTRINREFLKSLNPCSDRWENYLDHYADFEGSFVDFLNLDKITFKDKIWVLKKLDIPQDLLVIYAAACAYSVLDVYENKYPNDSRPRNAIKASLVAPAEAANAAANAYAAVFFAAYYSTSTDTAAANAAASAANAASAAYDDFEDVYIAYAAADAADAAYTAEGAGAREAKLIDILIEILEPKDLDAWKREYFKDL